MLVWLITKFDGMVRTWQLPHTARWTVRIPPRRQPNRPRRLLVVDDEQAGAEAIVALPSTAEYDAQFVLSGQVAMRALDPSTPEIALLDIHMPAMDGFAVARQLRKDGRTQFIVIVAFTSQAESTIRTEGIASGFDGGAVPDLLLRLLNRSPEAYEAVDLSATDLEM